MVEQSPKESYVAVMGTRNVGRGQRLDLVSLWLSLSLKSSTQPGLEFKKLDLGQEILFT